MTPTNVDLKIHTLFYEQCLKDLKVVVHNKSAKHASSAIQEYMAKISIDRYDADLKEILANCGLEPPSQCIEKVSLSSATVKQLHQYQRTVRDDEHIRKILMHLFDTNSANQTNIILRIHLARLFKIKLDKFDEYYASRRLIHLGKTYRLYFVTPTHCNCCKLFDYTDKTYMTLGYIAELFQKNTSNFKFYTTETSYYDRHEKEFMVLPHSISFDYNRCTYVIRFDCFMYSDDIDKRSAKFTISNNITYTKSRPGEKTIHEKMNYIFIKYDGDGYYWNKKTIRGEFVVLDDNFEYDFDSFEKNTRVSRDLKALVDEFKASESHMSFFHYFLTKLPIEKQLLFAATFFTRQSVYRDY
jgi:hypothetical protein